VHVTDVKVFPVNEDRLKAYATITFDDCFVVRDLKIIQGNAGLFVAMPSKRRKDGTFKDTAHPLNNETREMIETKVLAQFESELKRLGIDPRTLGARRPFPVAADEDYDDAPAGAPARMPPPPMPSSPQMIAPSARRAASDSDGDELPATYRSKV
jgi:stage V sporulation protein G